MGKIKHGNRNLQKCNIGMIFFLFYCITNLKADLINKKTPRGTKKDHLP